MIPLARAVNSKRTRYELRELYVTKSELVSVSIACWPFPAMLIALFVITTSSSRHDFFKRATSTTEWSYWVAVDKALNNTDGCRGQVIRVPKLLRERRRERSGNHEKLRVQEPREQMGRGFPRLAGVQYRLASIIIGLTQNYLVSS